MNRKEDILNSAERLARTRGYDGFSYADIEKDVGIRKASIHHHYASKAKLGHALVERYRINFRSLLDQISAEEPRASDRLNRFLDAYEDALSDGETMCLCVSFSAGRDSLSPEVLSELNKAHESFLDWIVETFTLGQRDRSIANIVDPQNEALASLALVEGAQLLARATKDTAQFRTAVLGLRARTQN